MSEEFKTVDFSSVLANRLMYKKAENTPSATPVNGFDPYEMMLKKQRGEYVPSKIETKSWPDKDIKALEEFCQQHGIYGFSCGMMNPIAALNMLKQKMGIVTNNESSNYKKYEDSQKMLLKD